jgi:hypothetical protein
VGIGGEGEYRVREWGYPANAVNAQTRLLRLILGVGVNVRFWLQYCVCVCVLCWVFFTCHSGCSISLEHFKFY